MPCKSPMKTAAVTAAILLGAGTLGSHVASVSVRTDIARFVAATPGLSVGAVDVDLFGNRLTLRDVALANGSLHVYARALSVPANVAAMSSADISSLAFISPARAETVRAETVRPFRMAQWPRTESKPDAEPADDSGVNGIELKIPGQTPAVPKAAAPAPKAEAPTAKPEAPAAIAATPPKAPASVAVASATGTASATGVTIVSGTTTTTIEKIDLTGTPLSSTDLTALLDPKSPDTLADRLAKMTASTVVIPKFTSVNTADGATFEGETILLSDVVKGKIGTAAIAHLAFTTKRPNSDSLTKTGAVQATGLDLALLLQIASTKRTDEAMALKPIALSFSIANITNVDHDAAGNATVTIGGFSEMALMGRPLKASLAAVFDDPGKTASARDKTVAVDDLIDSFTFESIALDKFFLSMSGGKDASSKEAGDKDPTNVSIGKIALDGFHDRALGAFIIRDVLVGSGLGKGSVATVDLTHLVLPIFTVPTPTPTGSPDATSPTGPLPTIGKFDLSKFALDMISTKEDGTPLKLKFDIGHVGAAGDQTQSAGPKKGLLTVDDITFDVPLDTPMGKQFGDMGYTRMDLSSAMNASYDKGAETLQVPKFAISGADMGSLVLGVDLTSVGKNITSTNQELAKAAAFAMLMKSLDIKLTNQGLIDKALALKAKLDGKSVTEERDAIVGFIDGASDGLGTNPAIKTVASAVVAFVKDPKTLHLSAKSKDGFGAADIAMFTSPDDLLSRLDVTAEANK